MGETLRGAAGDGRDGRGAAQERLTRRLRAWAAVVAGALAFAAAPLAARPQGAGGTARAQPAADTAAVRIDSGRFTFVAYPPDVPFARALLASALARDTFPGLPRPRARVVLAVAPDERRFRSWVGPRAPEWGVAIAFPQSGRIVMRGRDAGAAREDPFTVLRHELAHLALHEALGGLAPRWFDEGYASYAAGEWGREEVLATNVALLFRRVPPLDTLERWLTGRSPQAQGAYALSHRAVAELAALDPDRGLTLLFRYWKETSRLDPAMRRAYGITLDAFEERWQSRTRFRYGVLALFGDVGVAALFVLLVTTPLVVARRRRDRRRMEALRAADRLEDLLAEKLAEELAEEARRGGTGEGAEVEREGTDAPVDAPRVDADAGETKRDAASLDSGFRRL